MIWAANPKEGAEKIGCIKKIFDSEATPYDFWEATLKIPGPIAQVSSAFEEMLQEQYRKDSNFIEKICKLEGENIHYTVESKTQNSLLICFYAESY